MSQSQTFTTTKQPAPVVALAALPETAPNHSPSMAVVLMRAVEMGAPIETLERIAKMIEEVEARADKAAFNDALSRTQSKLVPIINSARNEHLHTNYANLADINSVVVPIYSAEGLSVSYDTETQNDKDPVPAGMLRTVAIVGHARGHERRYHIDLAPDDSGSAGKVNKTKVQAAGSTNEYGRRYLARMIFNLATKDDTDDRDGNALTESKTCIDAAQVGTLQKLMGEVQQNTSRFFAYYQIKTLAELPAARYSEVVANLESKRNQKAAVAEAVAEHERNPACDRWVYDPKSKFCLHCGYRKVEHAAKAVA